MRQRHATAPPASVTPATERRGGVKRRVTASSQAAPDQNDLPFNKCMRRDWAKGYLPAKKVVEYAKASSDQGASGADILAGDPRNAHRFLVSAFGYPTKAPELEWIEIPYKNGQTVPHPFLCPLKWVQKVVDSPEIFVDIMSGPPGDITDFWYNLRNSPLYPHGVAGDKTIAASIHGDSAPTTDVDGLYLFSWSSFHASGSTIAKKIPITVVKSSDVSAETMKTLANRIAWSFNALSSGLMPNQDWLGRDQPDAGSQLCKGWRVANIALRGDWEFIQVFNGFPSPTSVPNMCWKCKASPHSGELCWTRHSMQAGWRRTLRTHDSWVQEVRDRGGELPAIFQIRTLRLEGVLGDAMHTIDQGITPSLVANVMCEVMETFGGNQDTKAKALDKHLKDWYKTTKEEYRIDGKLTYNRVKKSGQWPFLLCKAAACRRLASYALHLASEYNTNSNHDVWRKKACEALVSIYKIIGDAPRFLSPASQQELAHASRTFLAFYTKLAAEAFDNNQRLWKLIPKFHMGQHILEDDSAYLNPKHTWVYSDEDLQRIFKAIAQSAHSANTPYVVLFKWAVLKFDS